jgi:hypothetical protein
MTNRLRNITLLLAVLAVAAGCAEERPPINRVQAHAMAKSFFVGEDFVGPADNPEFWTQATLIDVGYGTQGYLLRSTFTMAPSRIKWEITEDLLLGRLAYERIEGTDGKGIGGPTPDGQVVVAYAIKKHFDIRRAYNPSTGEEMNVIEENTSDRPWFEREYLRVDWSQNLNTDAYDFDTLSLLGIYGGTSYSPLAYQVNDPDHEHAPHFAASEGYFDITNKAFATPEVIDLSHLGWGIDKFPACFLPNDFLGGSEPAGNCNPTEVTIRQGFRKVVDSDYVPVDWDGFRFQAYGGFYQDRFGYERNYGMTDDKWRRFLNRYQIWNRSHYYDNPADLEGPVECFTPDVNAQYGNDPNADEEKDGTADQCWEVVPHLAKAAGECEGMSDEDCYWDMNEEFGGSQCDTFKQKCTLPYRHRTLKPLAWHYTERSNLQYWDGTYWATHDHDVAMKHAAQVARYVECMSSGDDKVAYDDKKEQCVEDNPVYFGQMDDHLEAKQLAMEVDDCRAGLTFVGDNGQDDYGPINSADREDKCIDIADDIANARKLGAWEDFSPNRVAALVHLAKMPQQIVLCHSPVQANDPAACAPADQRLPEGMTMAECQAAYEAADRGTIKECRSARYARIGDLRYHAVNVFEEPQSPSFWGIYSDAEDPLTGEAFAASINVWSHVNDLWSQGVIDRVRYIKGELATEDITEGTYVKDYVAASEAANGAGSGERYTKKQINERLAAAVGMDVDTFNETRMNIDPQIHEHAKHLRSDLNGVYAMQGVAGFNAPAYEARRQALMGTEIEATLADPMMQHIAGVEELGLTQATLDYASPLRLLNPQLQEQMRNQFENALSDRGMCILQQAPAPIALTGLADVLERKFEKKWGKFGSYDPEEEVSDERWALDRAEAMRKYMANKAHYGVVVHEMGHSIGERHNFVSSSDAYNYRPQYWQLRTKNGTVTEECQDFTEDGSTCTGPRWFDPVDKDETDNLIHMWMHSSVMDYAGEYTQDMLGLGAYDFAAHRSFYGDAVAVFADESYEKGEDRADWMFFKMDSFGGLLGYQPQMTFNEPGEGIVSSDIHYSQYNKHYGLIQDCKEVDVEQYRPASWDEDKLGTWDPVVDGLIVSVDGKYTKCRQQPVDYVSWKNMRFPVMAELKDAAHVSYEPFYRGGPSLDKNDRLRVPYGFATDRWADLGNAAVYRHDNGADNYEVFNFFITQQEVQHIFDNYRRGRQNFSVRSASMRTLGRYNGKIRDGAKGVSLIKNIYAELSEEVGITSSSLWAFAAANWFPDQIVASGMVFDHFARTFARPEPGDHIRDTIPGNNNVLRSNEDTYLDGQPVITIPNGATGYFGRLTFGGKLVENRLCETTFDAEGNVQEGCGEYDANFTMNAGSYYDKAWTAYLMTESEDNFISDTRTDFTDGRHRAVSLADLFPDGFRRFMANYLTRDIQTTALYVAGDADGQPMVDMENNSGATYRWPSLPVGTVSWWTDEPEVCFPAAGTTICNTYDAYSSHALQFKPLAPDTALQLDPQVDWGQQKFLIFDTLMYLPANQMRDWLDMMRLWRLGEDSDPGMPEAARIEWHNPQGDTFVARRYGTEVIFGKTVEKGIAARVLEYTNELMEQAYVGTWNATGVTYLPDYDPTTGAPIVKYDSSMTNQGPPVKANCNIGDNSGCVCEDNRACIMLQNYATVPYFLWEVADRMYYGNPDQKGIYN